MKNPIPFPYILIAAAFFAGLLLSGGNDAEKELLQGYKAERKLLMDKVVEKQVEIQRLTEAQQAIEAQRVQDSIRFAGALERNQRAYLALKKKYNEINLSRATVHDLDSIVSVLFPN